MRNRVFFLIFSPHPNPLPKGEGIAILKILFFMPLGKSGVSIDFFRYYPLYLWERVGVRALNTIHRLFVWFCAVFEHLSSYWRLSIKHFYSCIFKYITPNGFNICLNIRSVFYRIVAFIIINGSLNMVLA